MSWQCMRRGLTASSPPNGTFSLTYLPNRSLHLLTVMLLTELAECMDVSHLSWHRSTQIGSQEANTITVQNTIKSSQFKLWVRAPVLGQHDHPSHPFDRIWSLCGVDSSSRKSQNTFHTLCQWPDIPCGCLSWVSWLFSFFIFCKASLDWFYWLVCTYTLLSVLFAGQDIVAIDLDGALKCVLTIIPTIGE